MNTKHTPGPWYKSEDFINFEYADSDGNRHHGTIAVMALRGEAKQANARLIAAAPELLEALEEALTAPFGLVRGDDARKQADFVTKARAAIAKAKGEE